MQNQIKRILKAAKEKQKVIYKRKHNRITADFSTQTVNSRKAWKRYISNPERNNYQSGQVYQAKLNFIIEG
jgi:ubiquitin-protein ligase